MSERVKTVLLILFIVGVIGAFNSIISLSQSSNESPFQLIARTLGLTKKPAPEQGRKLQYIPSELQKGYTPTTSTTGSTTSPTPTPKPTAVPAAIQTSPELPPLPPIGGVKGIKTSNLPPLPPIGNVKGIKTVNLPPLPPINKSSKTLGATAQNSFGINIKDILNFFGF